jgi:hypothetical protein
MKEPSLKVIGIYRPAISAEMWREQFQVTGDEQATNEHFEKLVLIEAEVEGLTGRFDFSKFGQILSGYRNYPDSMQVGYDEGLFLCGRRNSDSAENALRTRDRVSALRAVFAFLRSPSAASVARWRSIVPIRARRTNPFDEADAVPRLQLKLAGPVKTCKRLIAAIGNSEIKQPGQRVGLSSGSLVHSAQMATSHLRHPT